MEIINTSVQNTLVQQANRLFREGRYADAQPLYIKAAEQYGQKNFKANLMLCEKRQNSGSGQRGKDSTDNAVKVFDTNRVSESINVQLINTQKLLEHYFQRCEELKYQLMDVK